MNKEDLALKKNNGRYAIKPNPTKPIKVEKVGDYSYLFKSVIKLSNIVILKNCNKN